MGFQKNGDFKMLNKDLNQQAKFKESILSEIKWDIILEKLLLHLMKMTAPKKQQMNLTTKKSIIL